MLLRSSTINPEVVLGFMTSLHWQHACLLSFQSCPPVGAVLVEPKILIQQSCHSSDSQNCFNAWLSSVTHARNKDVCTKPEESMLYLSGIVLVNHLCPAWVADETERSNFCASKEWQICSILNMRRWAEPR